jgi:tetratricopeptide (TPR) repeat protein
MTALADETSAPSWQRMRRRPIALFAIALVFLAGCNPFYSVEQSMVERGYRWIRRGQPDKAASTFQMTIRNYPESVLGQIGLGDAFYAIGRYGDCVISYSAAIMLIGKTRAHRGDAKHGEPELVGKRTFSYQNQGLNFTHGVEAYALLHRGYAHEELAKDMPTKESEHLSAAIGDYTETLRIAPDYAAAKEALDRIGRTRPPDATVTPKKTPHAAGFEAQ